MYRIGCIINRQNQFAKSPKSPQFPQFHYNTRCVDNLGNIQLSTGHCIIKIVKLYVFLSHEQTKEALA